MHPSLVAPWQRCEAVRERLRGVLAGLAPDAWTSRPDRETWSLAEQVDHLVRSEVGTSKMARWIIRGDFKDKTRSADAVLYDSRLDVYPYGRLTAPDVLRPSALPLPEAQAQLESVHRRFQEELQRFEGSDADQLAAPDPLTGVWFTLAGWVCLQALHEEHHLLQIRRLLAR
jgi:hypothetical protein